MPKSLLNKINKSKRLSSSARAAEIQCFGMSKPQDLVDFIFWFTPDRRRAIGRADFVWHGIPEREAVQAIDWDKTQGQPLDLEGYEF